MSCSAPARVHRFGDNVTTDDIIAGKYKHKTIDLGELSAHAMENIRPDFAGEVKAGDVVVAGSNFGCGSSREQAPAVLKHIGIAAVVAPTFARIFFRNAINVGLPVMMCDTDGIAEGDLVTLDLDASELSVPARDLTVVTAPLPKHVRDLIADGGLIARVRARGRL